MERERRKEDQDNRTKLRAELNEDQRIALSAPIAAAARG